MSDHTNHNTYVRDTRVTEASGGNATGFILGALAVAVLVIVWAVLSGADAPSAGPAGGDTNNVTIEAPAAPPAGAPVETAPADVAPADPAPAAEPAVPPAGN